MEKPKVIGDKNMTEFEVVEVEGEKGEEEK
jgi:hypothetical protein